MSTDIYPYLQALHHTVVGPDRIVCQITHIPSKNFHAVYASGIAPRLIKGQSNDNGGWGADSNPQMAEIKAIVEAVERYALGEYDERQFHTLPNNAPALTADQLGVYKISPELNWTRLMGANTTTNLYAPLDFLYHPVDYTSLGRMPAAPLNISGIAAHQSLNAALISGILELCEHEALMVAWHRQKPLATISQVELDSEVVSWIDILHTFGWKIILKDISLDLAPAVMAVGLGPKGKRALSIGSCAAFTLRYATKKAVSEVLRTALADEATSPKFASIGKEDVHDMAAHELYYAHHENLKEIRWLWEGGKLICASDFLTDGTGRTLAEAQHEWNESADPIKCEREYICGLLQEKGVLAYYKEITPKAVLEAKVPLVVVRILAPEMVRLTVGYGRLPARTQRFSQFVNTEKLNTGLHPFS